MILLFFITFSLPLWLAFPNNFCNYQMGFYCSLFPLVLSFSYAVLIPLFGSSQNFQFYLKSACPPPPTVLRDVFPFTFYFLNLFPLLHFRKFQRLKSRFGEAWDFKKLRPWEVGWAIGICGHVCWNSKRRLPSIVCRPRRKLPFFLYIYVYMETSAYI
jgi:hypothetical protein